jgi:hypothetical protein
VPVVWSASSGGLKRGHSSGSRGAGGAVKLPTSGGELPQRRGPGRGRQARRAAGQVGDGWRRSISRRRCGRAGRTRGGRAGPRRARRSGEQARAGPALPGFWASSHAGTSSMMCHRLSRSARRSSSKRASSLPGWSWRTRIHSAIAPWPSCEVLLADLGALLEEVDLGVGVDRLADHLLEDGEQESAPTRGLPGARAVVERGGQLADLREHGVGGVVGDGLLEGAQGGEQVAALLVLDAGGLAEADEGAAGVALAGLGRRRARGGARRAGPTGRGARRAGSGGP